MRPVSPSLVKHYPLALGLLVLLLPYCYRLLLLPFTLRGYLSSKRASDNIEVNTTTSTVSLSTFSTTSTTREARSASRGYNIWRGVREFVGPKWEDSSGKGEKSTISSVSIATKQQKPKKSSSTSVKFSTIKSIKTVTKSYTTSVTKSVTKSITKSVTETVQVAPEKQVEESAKTQTRDSIVIEQINSMGWHQVRFYGAYIDGRLHLLWHLGREAAI